jgi:hypothetical protein
LTEGKTDEARESLSSSKAEKVKFSEEATGEMIEEIRERVSLTDERKSMR